MSLSLLLRPSAIRAAALVVVVGYAGLAGASDPAPVLPDNYPLSAGPAAMPGGGNCPTCRGTPRSTGCTTCGKGCKGLIFHKTYTPQLCPGACFGYFQTQWHRWEDVCPIPYQGTGLSDVPVRPAPAVAAPVVPKGSDQPLPAPAPMPPVDTSKGKGTDLPSPKPLIPTPGPGTGTGSLPIPPILNKKP